MDITLCRNVSCPFNDSCYRYNTSPHEGLLGQSYAAFQPMWDDMKEEWQCEYYIPMESGK